MLTGWARRGSPADGEAGFTLVELLVTMSIMLVIGGVAVSGTVAGMQATRRGQARVFALADLQVAVERIAREVRVADGADYPAGVDGELLVALPDDVQFDVFRSSGTERLRYRYWRDGAAPDVLRGCREVYAPPATPCVTAGAGAPLLHDLANGAVPVFAYLDAAGVQGAIGEDIRQVTITLLRSLPEQGQIRIETTVGLRNADG
jgi:prepilin-type N-terminal cleavage/methylation domain-containing protein